MPISRPVLSLTFAAAAIVALSACAPISGGRGPTPAPPPAKASLAFVPSTPSVAAVAVPPPDAMRADDVVMMADVIKLLATEYYRPIPMSRIIQACMVALDVPPPTRERSAEDEARALTDALLDWGRRHPAEPRSMAAERCVRGALKVTDRESFFLDEAEVVAMFEQPSPASIGVEFRAVAQGAEFVAVLPGGPAAKAGLSKGALITHIDGEVLAGLSMAAISLRLRGEPGATIDLTLRDEFGTRTVRLARAVIAHDAIQARRDPQGLLVIEVGAFGWHAPHRMAALVRESLAAPEGAPKGVVIDLRGSRGGLLDASAALAELFLPEGAFILEEKGRAADANRRVVAGAEWRRGAYAKTPRPVAPAEARTLPLAVLIGDGTSAGAEILAAALQDNRRATLIGSRTAAKLTIDSVFRLRTRKVAVRMTTGLAYRPKGQAIDGVGVQPDLVVLAAAKPEQPGSRGTRDDLVLARARQVLLKP